MTETTLGIPLGSWLAELPDDRLIRLLELRPDLAQPPPGSIAALAARAQARQSLKAASDELDFLRLSVIDALLVLQADTASVPVAKLLTLIGERAPEAEILDALDDLKQRALVWGDVELRLAPDAGAGLPWHVGQVTLEDASQSGEQIAELIDGLDEPQRELLDRLLEGSPLGRTRDAAPGAPADRPVPQLLSIGLLRRIDADTVILPRHVGQVLRGEEPGPVRLAAPDPVVSSTTPADADAAAGGAIIDLLRELDVLLETLSAAPISELRSGGLGVREVRRLAKITGVEEARLGLILELAAAAGLIASGIPDPLPIGGEPPYWAPTVAADRFAEASTAERWHLLATTWLDLAARPALTGSRGPDGKPYAALSDSLYSTAAPLDRRLLLDMLAQLPPGAGVDKNTASAALIWLRPRWSKRLQPGPVADLLEEAQTLGLVGRGAISTPGRAFIDRVDDGDAIAAMARVLPPPIDHFLVQADLTVVVPGPLQRHLADELSAVATVESAGTAMVYRVSEQSIRHALDIGKTADELHNLFQQELQNACTARLDIPDRRCCTAARAIADRDGRIIRALRRSDAARPGGGRRRSSRPAGAGTDRGDLAGADQRSARDAAGRRIRSSSRGLHRHHRRHPGPRSAGSHAAAPPPAPAGAAPEQRNPQRGRRRAAQSDRGAVRQRPDRPGGCHVTAAASRSAGRDSTDQLRRRRRGGHAAGGIADHGGGRSAGGVRLGLQPSP